MTNIREISSDELTLKLQKEVPADPSKNWLQALHYDIYLKDTTLKVGSIDIRVGYTTSVVLYGGHIGYGIDEEFRGNHYAGKACLLLREFIKHLHLDVVWITCNPENIPSRKTCEWIGATLIEEIELPEDNDQYLEGERKKCRYRWIVF